jgi:hypothetical protein
MPIDPLVKILPKPLSDYDAETQTAIELAQRHWVETHVSNDDGTPEHREFVMSAARDYLRANRPDHKPAPPRNSGGRVTELAGGGCVVELPPKTDGPIVVTVGPPAPPARAKDYDQRSRSSTPGERIAAERAERAAAFAKGGSRGYIAGAKNLGDVHRYVDASDSDSTGRTYGSVSQRVTPRHPWQKK